MAIIDDPWLSEEDKIVQEAQKRFRACEDWESQAWTNFDYDYKFANGDSVNMFQWDNWVVGDRIDLDRPCLTINKTMQHNLMIINDGKQNKPGVNIRPVGEDASFEAAQIFEEVIRHIEYLSNAENVYDSASEFQVIGGIGYWRIVTDWLDPSKGLEQEIYIKRIKHPKSVRLDPDINEIDGSDARFGFIFNDIPRDLYETDYPDFKDVGGNAVLNGSADGWYSNDHIRVAEYFRKNPKKDKWIEFTLPETQEEIKGYYSELKKNNPDAIATYEAIKKHEKNLAYEDQTYQEREVVKNNIEWYKIAGNTIISKKPWLGRYIPIIRIVGVETVIDGQLDRKGHTRSLLDPQRIYNINSSANVEFGALQTKSPFRAAADAIEGYEDYYRLSNTNNAAVLLYNAFDDEGRPLPPPDRLQAPQSSPAYVQQMQIAQNEMMMVSGLYQAQLGENENAKSGIAINQRQRQGDRATYHFPDGQAIGIRNTGKQLIDLIPKIYNKKRLMRIEAKDGTILNLTIDPSHPNAMTKQPVDPNSPQSNDNKVIDIIFNPSVGNYAVVSDTGPSFATRRQEAFNALTQIAAQNKDFMNVGGDLLWKVADFPEAQELARRWRRIIPPNITGDAPNPQLTQAMQQASAKIEQQLNIITKQTKELADKERELDIKEREIALREKEAKVREIREDYKAENERLQTLGNSGPAVTPEQIQPVLQQLLKDMLASGNADAFKQAIGIRDIENNAMTSDRQDKISGNVGTDDAPASQ
jgi:hypothetical protein